MLKNNAELVKSRGTSLIILSHTRSSNEYEIELSVNHFLHPHIAFGGREAPQEEIYPIPDFIKWELEFWPALEISQLRN